MDDLALIEKLQQENQKVLEQNAKTQESRKNIKKDYVQLREKLSTLADKTTLPVMIPVGSVGFFPGTLIHTNEMMVLLGDNWFAERSTKQSIEIVDRRIQLIDRQLADLNEECKNMKSYLQFGHQFQQDKEEYNGIKEIKEELPAEPALVSKGKRQAHTPKHNLTERKVIFKSESTNVVASDPSPINHDELLARLNQLEKEEEEESLRENEETLKHLLSSNQTPAGSSDINNKSRPESDNQSNMSKKQLHQHCRSFDETTLQDNNKRHVKFDTDTSGQDEACGTNIITFSHTSTSQRERSASESDLRCMRKELKSPADIYDQFLQQHTQEDNEPPLKSILKKDSRSNSTENLKLKPILKTSPEHRPDTSEYNMEEPNSILKTPPDTQSSERRPATPEYVNLDEPRPILKTTSIDNSNQLIHSEILLDDPKPILKSFHEVHFSDATIIDDVYDSTNDEMRSILKQSNSSASPLKRPGTPEEDRKSILKSPNSKLNNDAASAFKDSSRPILKNNEAFSANVVEHNAAESLNRNDVEQKEVTSSKPVSRFKASRQKR